MINGRVGRWVEFRFWQLVVRGLSLLRPVQRRLASHRIQSGRKEQPSSREFAPMLITALAGWGLGLALGYMLMQMWF